MEWIKITDELPHECTAVLLASEGQVSEMYFHNGAFDFPRGDVIPDSYDLEFLKRATHWMPLPEPPKE